MAVKIYKTQEKDIFSREIQILQKIKDKGLEKKFIRIFGAVETDSEYWIVMGFIEGLKVS